MKKHSYIPQRMKIIAREALSDDTIGLRLKIPTGKHTTFKPGQFVMLSVDGFGEVPIGITTSPKEVGYIEVAVRSVGTVTQKICSLVVGDYLGVSGPFGNGFPMSKLKDRDVVIVAGGLGLAPLRSLIRHIEKTKNHVKSLTILYGSKSEECLLYRTEYEDWERFSKLSLTLDACDADWQGCVGNITKLFNRAEIKRGSVMIVCGPPIMFPEVAQRYAGKTVADSDLYFLLERRMKCGVGKCQHCTCGELYVCLDGPVFSYDQLKYNQEAFK